MSNKCAKALGLMRFPNKTEVYGPNRARLNTKGMVEVLMCHREEERQILRTTFIIVDEEPPDQPTASFKGVTTGFELWNDRALADPGYQDRGPIEVLLGAEVWAKTIGEDIQRSKTGLLAQKSEFGYLIFGAYHERSGNIRSCLHI